MRDWHHDIRTDIGLRLSGAALCGVAWLAAHGLAALHLSESHTIPGAWVATLAAAAFLCVSLGAVLITQGRHIFDRVDISERWQARTPSSPAEMADDGNEAYQPHSLPGTDEGKLHGFDVSRTR